MLSIDLSRSDWVIGMNGVFKSWQNVCVCLIAAVLLSACQTPGPGSVKESNDADDALMNALAAQTDWSVQGSLGIWAEKTATSEEQNITASMAWSEKQELLDVVLRGPLGVGEMSLTANASAAELRRGNQRVQGRDPSLLVQRALNLAVPVPLSELSHWMRGLPGAADDARYDDQGRLKTLRYTDASGVAWRATVRRYTQSNGLSVPSLISAKGGPYNVRLVLKDWRFDPTNPDDKPATNDSAGRLSIPGRSS